MLDRTTTEFSHVKPTDSSHGVVENDIHLGTCAHRGWHMCIQGRACVHTGKAYVYTMEGAQWGLGASAYRWDEGGTLSHENV